MDAIRCIAHRRPFAHGCQHAHVVALACTVSSPLSPATSTTERLPPPIRHANWIPSSTSSLISLCHCGQG